MEKIMRCSNKYCYISGVLLTEDNISDEHIIPNALGGHLKCPDLVCSNINNDLFGKIDAQLAKSLELAQLINFKRERGDQPSIVGVNSEGIKYLINNNNTGTIMPLKPFLLVDESGKSFMKFPSGQKEEYFKSKLKKNPQLSRSDLESKYQIVIEDKKEKIDYKNGLAIFPNKEPFRGIAKIATNFCVLNNLSNTNFPNLLEFIKGSNDLSSINLGYFYPKELLSYKFGEEEISHILYLRGNKEENILYCYIELFNTHCFIVILNHQYSGMSFEKSYIWDLLKAKELKKDISLDLSRSYLEQREYMVYPGVEKDYSERLKRTNEICDLRIIF